jgi:hypothetical protein
MATKMTAVQWLEIAVQNKLASEMGPYFQEAFEQAKQMEKEQIIDAYEIGHDEGIQIITEYDTAQDYYTSTYNQ